MGTKTCNKKLHIYNIIIIHLYMYLSVFFFFFLLTFFHYMSLSRIIRIPMRLSSRHIPKRIRNLFSLLSSYILYMYDSAKVRYSFFPKRTIISSYNSLMYVYWVLLALLLHPVFIFYPSVYKI